VRSEATKRGLGTDLPALETLGRALIAEWGWDRFCRSVLPDLANTEYLVVDGVRHIAAAETLRRLGRPARFGLVFVDADDLLREERISSRARKSNGRTEETADRMADELGQLRAASDLVVDGATEGAARIIATWAEQKPVTS
jgi:hypothetical protein